MQLFNSQQLDWFELAPAQEVRVLGQCVRFSNLIV